MGLGPYLSPMFLHQSFGDGQAQSCSTMFTTFHLIEFFKDLFHLILRNTNPGVSNLMEDKGILSTGGGCDLASIGRKFESIEEDIDKDVMKPPPIGTDLEVIGDLDLNGEGFIHGLDLLCVAVNHLREKDHFPGEEETAGSDPC